MWTASQMREVKTENRDSAVFGTVTASGAENGVFLGTERRHLPVMAPGGYHWRPRAGETVLVLKAGDRSELPCILACQPSDTPDLQPGEVELTGPACSVKLVQDGTVRVQGTLMVNGRTLHELIQSAVCAAIAEQGG